MHFVVLRFLNAIYCEITPRWARLRRRMPLSILAERIKKHRDWIDSKGDEGEQLVLFSRNLSSYDLSSLELEQATFRDCDFRRCRFVNFRESAEKQPHEDEPEDESDWRNHRHHDRLTTMSKLVDVDFSYSIFEQAAFAIPDTFGGD